MDEKDTLIRRQRAAITALQRRVETQKAELRALQKGLRRAKQNNPPFAYWMLDADGELVDLETLDSDTPTPPERE